MATTTRQTVDVAQALAGLLAEVDGLRVYWHVADDTRPPAAVIGQPDIDPTEPSAAFCRALWIFPLTVVVSRSNARDAQVEMSRLLLDIFTALDVDSPDLFSVEPQVARPAPGVTVGGQELPAYQLPIHIRA